MAKKKNDDDLNEDGSSIPSKKINPDHLKPQEETEAPERPKAVDPKHLKPQE